MKYLQDWLVGIATALLVIATFFLYRATEHLVTVEKEHGTLEANKAAVESLFRLQNVMDSTPNTRECMRYVLSVSKQKYLREDNDYLHDLMNNNQPVPVFNEEPFVGQLHACLGGFFAHRPEAANPNLSKDMFDSLYADAARTHIRQQIVNFANVLDVASSFLLLDRRFYKPEEQIEKDMAKLESLSDPAYLVWKELRGVTGDSKRFFLKWHEGSKAPLFEEFPMCRIVAKRKGEDCGL
jgi:hypothetical protein